tara:strand:+ start:609 stop:1295 length:687 start_codon:yes stop_codon:yes gene_type:complete
MKSFINEIKDKFNELSETYDLRDDVKVGQTVKDGEGERYKVIKVTKDKVILKTLSDKRGWTTTFPDDFGNDVQSDDFWYSLSEANVTSNLDGGEGPPRTPHAFSKSTDEDDLDTKHIEVMGYKKTKKTNKHHVALEALERKLENQINEISYKEFKKDDSRKQYQKVNDSIKKMNRMMYEMERVVNQNIKLKNEAGVNNGQYWKSTQKRLVKISERLKIVSNKIKELGS